MTSILSKGILILSVTLLYTNSNAQNSSSDVGRVNTVSTAVPFLRITPDARSGGMGDVGIATSADATAVYYNASKLVFSEKKMGISMSYTPWLKNLGISDIFLAHLAGYYKIDELQSFHSSSRIYTI